MSNRGSSELALRPLAPSDYGMVMAKSRENRLTFATWLMFFRDHVAADAGGAIEPLIA